MCTHVRSSIYAYAKRLDPGQPLSNSAAGLRSNLFATQSIITHDKQAEFTGLKKQTTIWPASCEKGPSDMCKKCRPRPAAASLMQRLIRVCTS